MTPIFAFSDPVILAFIGLGVTASPIIVVALTRWLDSRAAVMKARVEAEIKLAESAAKRLEKQEDWKRLDDVAAAAKEAAKVSADNLKVNTESANAVNAFAEHTNLQLVSVLANGDAIHGLVNSNLTESKKVTLAQMQITLALMQDKIDALRKAKKAVPESVANAFKLQELAIGDLEQEVKLRLEQTAVADAQVLAGRPTSALTPVLPPDAPTDADTPGPVAPAAIPVIPLSETESV